MFGQPCLHSDSDPVTRKQGLSTTVAMISREWILRTRGIRPLAQGLVKCGCPNGNGEGRTSSYQMCHDESRVWPESHVKCRASRDAIVLWCWLVACWHEALSVCPVSGRVEPRKVVSVLAHGPTGRLRDQREGLLAHDHLTDDERLAF